MSNPQTTENPNYQDAIQFARLVLPTSGFKAGWRKSDKKNMFYDSVEQLVEQQLRSTLNGESNWYMSIPSYQNKADRKADSALAYRALMLDLDAGERKFLKHRDLVYATQNRAIEDLKRSGSAKLNRSDKCIIGVFSLGKGAGAGDLYEQIIWAANAPRV